jgi:hypothetical protein
VDKEEKEKEKEKSESFRNVTNYYKEGGGRGELLNRVIT